MLCETRWSTLSAAQELRRAAGWNFLGGATSNPKRLYPRFANIPSFTFSRINTRADFSNRRALVDDALVSGNPLRNGQQSDAYCGVPPCNPPVPRAVVALTLTFKRPSWVHPLPQDSIMMASTETEQDSFAESQLPRGVGGVGALWASARAPPADEESARFDGQTVLIVGATAGVVRVQSYLARDPD